MRRYPKKPIEKDWRKVKVWYSATHKWSHITHIAAYASGARLVTRCGQIFYPRTTKAFKLYEWQRGGGSPVVPTCGLCLRLRKQDIEEM
jgi:hypothetical protein